MPKHAIDVLLNEKDRKIDDLEEELENIKNELKINTILLDAEKTRSEKLVKELKDCKSRLEDIKSFVKAMVI